MATEKINVKIEADYNDREAKQAIRDAEQLDGIDPTVEIDADADQATAAIRDVKEELEDVPSAADQVAAAVVEMADRIDTESRAAADAADALRLALGNAADRIDASEAVAEFQKMGLSADEVRADVDKLADALKHADDLDMKRAAAGIDTAGDAARRASTDMDRLGSSSDQSRSVLANLAGNATQDLGALSGVAGTAGMAMGQLAEYATEGNISFRNLASVAGPMIGILAGIEVAGNLMKFFGAESKRAAAETETMVEALKEEGSVLAAANSLLAESGELLSPDNIDDSFLRELGEAFLGLGEGENNLNEALARSGISFGMWNRAVSGSVLEAQSLTTSIMEAAKAGAISEDQEHDLVAALYASRTAWKASADVVDEYNKLTASTTGDANDALARLNETQGQTIDAWAAVTDDMIRNGQVTDASINSWNQLQTILQLTPDALAEIADQKVADELARQGQAADVLADAIEGANTEMAAMADSSREAQAIMAGADWGATTIDAAAEALSGYFQTFQAADTHVADLEGAYDDLGAAIDESGVFYDVTSPEGRRTFDALKQLGTQLIPDITQAYKDSHGDVEQFKANMGVLGEDTLVTLEEQLGISRDEANHLAQELGLVPENVETMYQLIGDADAVAKLALLQGVIDDLPEDVQTEIAMHILADDPQAALAAAQAEIERRADLSATVVIDADVSQALQAIANLQAAIRGAQRLAAAAGATTRATVTSSLPTSTTYVSVNVPRGTRPDDMIAAADRYARRNGAAYAYR